jgi:hypothetical protein
MPTIQHSALTTTDVHEPKGITTATNNQVYVADGANSGAWTDLTISFSAVIADVSTAETIYIPMPYAGTIAKVTTVLEGAITVADATINVKNSSAVSMGTITVAYTSSAAGDVDSLSPASNNTVTADDYITVETDGGSTNAQRLWVTIILERS